MKLILFLILGYIAKNLFNSQWRQILSQSLPQFQKATEGLLKNQFYNFFKKYPYDLLFPKQTQTNL